MFSALATAFAIAGPVVAQAPAQAAGMAFTCGAALFDTLPAAPGGATRRVLETAVAATYWVTEAQLSGLAAVDALRLRDAVDRMPREGIETLARHCLADGLARFKDLPAARRAQIVEMAAASVGEGS